MKDESPGLLYQAVLNAKKLGIYANDFVYQCGTSLCCVVSGGGATSIGLVERSMLRPDLLALP